MRQNLHTPRAHLALRILTLCLTFMVACDDINCADDDDDFTTKRERTCPRGSFPNNTCTAPINVNLVPDKRIEVNAFDDDTNKLHWYTVNGCPNGTVEFANSFEEGATVSMFETTATCDAATGDISTTPITALFVTSVFRQPFTLPASGKAIFRVKAASFELFECQQIIISFILTCPGPSDDDVTTGDDDDFTTGNDDDFTTDDDDDDLTTGDDDDDDLTTTDDDDDDDDSTTTDDDDDDGAPFNPDTDLRTVTLVSTTSLVGNVFCFEDPCNDAILAGPFYDARRETGLSPPFAQPAIALPIGREVRVRVYNYSDLLLERGAISCVGDDFPNSSYITTTPAALRYARTFSLVVFAGVEPDTTSPLKFPTTCGPAPATTCPDALKPAFRLYPACNTEGDVARVRAVNATPAFTSIRVTNTRRDDSIERDFAASLPYAEATAYAELPPSTDDLITDSWLAYDTANPTESFARADLGFPLQYATTTDFPRTGTCSTIVIAQDPFFPDDKGRAMFLVSEDPLLCEPFDRDDATPTIYPTCGN